MPDRRYTRTAATGTVTITVHSNPDGTVRLDLPVLDALLRGQGWTELLEETPTRD